MGCLCSKKIPEQNSSHHVEAILNPQIDLFRENLHSKQDQGKPAFSLVKGVKSFHGNKPKKSKVNPNKPKISRMGQGPTPVRVIVIGKIGSGKTFVNAELPKDYDLTNLSMADLVRNEVENGPILDIEEKQKIKTTKFVETPTIMKILKSALDSTDAKEFLLEGFSPNIDQAIELDKTLDELKKPLTLVIYLKVEDTILEKRVPRVCDRLIHPRSGRIYRLAFNPPKIEGKDDFTGENLVRIPDDKPDALQRKFQDCDNELTTLLNYYGEKGILKEVDASSDMEQTLRYISRVILRLKFKG